jgi:hypothetical protein
MSFLPAIYEHSKGVNNLLNSAGLGLTAIGKVIEVMGNVQQADDFNAFYQSKDSTLLDLTTNRLLSDQVVRLALHLPAALARYYDQSPYFNQIRIPGDDRNQFASLEMKDYFVHLSFLERENLERRNSRNELMALELESARRKVGTGSLDSDLRSGQYTSEIIVNNFPKSIIFGNPGVGKSTYARWVCNRWSYSVVDLEKIPVFIELKYLNFDPTSDENSIIGYIQEQYLQEQTAIYKEVFKHLGEHLTLICDGFDEIPREGKKRFKQHLNQLLGQNPKLNYILLGRPYAFFDQHFEGARLIQIDGFNEASIRNYAENFFQNNPSSGKSSKELIEGIVNQNEILVDYAHNPLILSSILLFYLTGEDAPNQLLGIRSKYELYNRVYQWLSDYNLRHKEQEEIDPVRLREAYRFAEYCSLHQQFYYDGDRLDDQYYEDARLFSKAGFGSLYRTGRGERWRFSFYSVTLQEYFTAERMAESISAQHFMCLARHSFFWNTCTLIIGGLVYRKKYDLIISVFEAMERDDRFTNSDQFQYFKYSLISECDQKLLEKLLPPAAFEVLVDSFEASYFDSTWNHLIVDSIRKIYPKLRMGSRHQLREVLLSKMDALQEVDHQKREGAVGAYVIMELGIVMKLAADDQFLHRLFSFLEKLIHRLREVIRESHTYDPDAVDADEISDRLFREEQELNQIVFVLLRVLDHAPIRLLKKYSVLLGTFYQLVPLDLKNDIAFLQAKFQPVEAIVSEIETHLETVAELDNPWENTVGSLPERLHVDLPTGQSQRDYPLEIIHLVHSFYKYCEQQKTILPDHQDLMQSVVNNIDRVFLNPLYSDSRDEIRLNTEVLISALSQLEQEDDILELLYHFYTRADLEEMLVSFVNRAVFNRKTEVLVKDILKEAKIEDVSFFRFLLRNTEVGRFSFGYLKSDFKKVAEAYTTQEMEILSGEDWEEHEEVVNALDRLFTAPHFDFDRKISIDIALELAASYPLFKNMVLPDLFERQTDIFETRYLDYFRKHFYHPGYATQLSYYLDNSGFYHFESNIPFLRRSFEFILEELPNEPELLDHQAFFLIMACSRFLSLIKRSAQYNIEDVAPLMGAFLEKEELKAVIENQDQLNVEAFEPEDLLAYILLYSATTSATHCVQFDYELYKQEEKSGAQKLLVILARLFVPNQSRAELEDTVYLHAVMGDILYKDFVDYVVHFYLRPEQFDIDKYLAL